MNIEYDQEVDAAYLRLTSEKVARTQVVTPYVNVDLDAHGQVVGIEFLYASKAVGDVTPWLTLTEASSYLNVPVEGLRRWIREGELRAYQFGRRKQLRQADLDRFIEAHRLREA